ncbi:carboxypeptidase-like regulatory domain-containing protein [Pedobacter insulae]|uniref:CarboxypepD_reg-like domain-containing protein n=1 Tax=Pedobacter insulae TaxID=414048 RepID=A0A1I2STE9_9SPHI|nr:carboxypeptidase-like regulatory domain-containing protein [Pedobacter insulae]SFG55928.1 hypothetical protein SAMN04489864_10144 [Pedobacter insulae]
MFLIRIPAICLLLSWPTLLQAQNFNGVVKDVFSRAPIENAFIITPEITVSTNSKGEFVLSNMKLGDRIAVRIMGYETTEVVISTLPDTLQIYLRQSAITLEQVMIKTNRNYKLDSLNIRKEYANTFAYKGPSFSDAFILRDPSYNSPFGFSNPRSTASLVSLNILQVFNFLGKKNKDRTKLKKVLLRDEELNYIDHTFSRVKVQSITGLEGEQLTKFIRQYRPSILSLKKMTDYELTLYIKKSYEEFSKIKTPVN